MTGKQVTPSLFAEEKPPEPTGTHIVRVALESAADTEFDYLVPDALWPIEVGRRVEVPFGKGNRKAVAFCVEADVAAEKSFAAGGGKVRLKRVSKLVDEQPLLGPELMALARWISQYYVCPLGQVLAAMVPGAVKRAAGVRRQRCVYLAGPAEQVAAELRSSKQKEIVAALEQERALSPESAVEIGALTAQVDCRPPTVKRLADKQIVKVVERKVLSALPVVPPGMANEAHEVVLNADQACALEQIIGRIDTGGFGVTLLHGVTDSGKTELYIRAIERIVQEGRAAIVLLPEIALTAQTVQRFGARFERVAVMHSGLTAGQRNVQWQKIRAGETDVVIGARSAVFAPLPRLGLVVVDEEHEPSYKQDTVPRYHGRDVAIKRAQLAGAHCILGSATPSLESLRNSQARRDYTRVRLPRRVMDLPMPSMKLVDMRQPGVTPGRLDLLSTALVDHLTQTLARQEQAILLLNRRGYSNFVFCPSCKHTLQCRNCDATLTFHKTKRSTTPIETVTGKHIGFGYAICHHCLAQTLVPRACPLCGKAMTMIGLGSQRLEEELAAKFPEARVRRVDSDSMASQDYYRLLREFGQGRIDILAGTQILAKGLHFPNVTLVGVISADTCLYLPDFRSNERTFQLISQVAGRAGRSRKPGTVFVQTYFPEQPAIRFALQQDFDGFVREEMQHREACRLPPLWRLATIVLRDPTHEKLETAANTMRQRIDRIVTQEGLEVKVRGPMPAVISRIQRFHRIQIVVQSPDAVVMGRLFASLRASPPIRPSVKIAIDIDPVNLL